MPERLSPLWERIEKLASDSHGMRAYLVLQAAGVSATTVRLLRLGLAPKSERSREKIATALGVSVDELFPESG